MQGGSYLPPSNQIPSYPGRPLKDRGVAMVLEILPGLFGFVGIGWIYSGNVGIGLAFLLGLLAWNLIIMLPVTLLTGGFGLCCSIPINLVVLIVSVLMLNNHTRQHPELFGP